MTSCPRARRASAASIVARRAAEHGSNQPSLVKYAILSFLVLLYSSSFHVMGATPLSSSNILPSHIVSMNRLQQSTDLPIGPGVEGITSPSPCLSFGRGAIHPRLLILPVVGLKPDRPQNAAGILTEPPTSVPTPRGTHPVLTKAASPPLLPPGVRLRSQGLRVKPQTLLWLSGSIMHWLTFPRARMWQPLSLKIFANTESASEICLGWERTAIPPVIKQPFTPMQSLIEIGV